MAAGRVAFVLSFDREVQEGIPRAVVKVDPGDGKQPTTHDHWQPAGEDSAPCVGDAVLLVDSSSGTNEEEIVGYADVNNAGTSAPGERQFHGRDPSGTIVVTLHLKGNGAVEVRNGAGKLTLEVNGSVTITGDLNVNGEVKAKANTPGAVALSTHLHPDGMGGTGAPTPGT